MDIIDAFIVTIHEMLGHNKAARYLGQDPGYQNECRLCNGEDPKEIFKRPEKKSNG